MNKPYYSKVEIVKICFQEVRKRQNSQREDLRSMRTQASALIAMNGLVLTSFSAIFTHLDDSSLAQIFDQDDSVFLGMNLETLLAMLAFLVAFYCAIRVALPSPGWSFDLNAASVFDKFCGVEHQIEEFEYWSRLLKNCLKDVEANEKLMGKVISYMRYAIFGISFQIVFWLWNFANV